MKRHRPPIAPSPSSQRPLPPIVPTIPPIIGPKRRDRWARRDFIHLLVVVGNVVAFAVVQWEVPDPYLDEVFHIPQTMRYCDEDFDTWDESITTPPGLYLLTAIPLMTVHIPCTTPLLRLTNLNFTTIIIPFILSAILSSIQLLRPPISSTHPRLTNQPDSSISIPFTPTTHPDSHESQSLGKTNRNGSPSSEKQRGVEYEYESRRRWYHHLFWPSTSALVTSQFPLIFFFGNLYYTDVGSLGFVLGCWALGLRGRHWSASFVGALSLTIRQTNIVWVVFVLATSLLNLSRDIESEITKDRQPLGHPFSDPDLRTVDSPSEIPRIIISTSTTLLANPGRSLAILLPYIPTILAFLAFLKWNGGIVLGHKENHQAVLHFPQLLYFIAFGSLMLAPALFAHGLGRSVKGALGVGLGSWKRTLGSVIALLGMNLVVKYFTIIHPFLLADNRHYVFYLFNRIILPYPMAKYALTPGYLACSLLWIWRLGHTTGTTFLWLMGFVACTALVTVPTPLVEPRYFLIPFIILRVQLTSPSNRCTQPTTPMKASHLVDDNTKDSSRDGAPKIVEKREEREMEDWLELVWYGSINFLTLGLFLGWKFRWEGWDGWMRFMW